MSQRPHPRDLGYHPEVAEMFAPYRSGHGIGRVTRVDHAGADLLMVTRASVTPLRTTLGGGALSVAAADRFCLPVVGDWVVVRSWVDDRSTMEVVLPRRSILVDDAPGRSTHEPVAANFDVLVIVEPMTHCPDLDRIGGLLTMAQDNGARAVVALTKADDVSDSDPRVVAVGAAVPKVPVVPIDPAGPGIDELARLLAGTTAVMVGPSGAGKSALANALTVTGSEEGARTDRADGHRTDRPELVVVPGRGAIIDTPDLRPFRLVPPSDVEGPPGPSTRIQHAAAHPVPKKWRFRR